MYELVLELVGKGERWQFAKREVRIGRDPNCDLVLPTEEYPMVSRSHLLIRLAAERYWVEDLNTPGGTFVNGVPVQVNPLSDGDTLRLGVDGPELRAQIVASYRLESQDVPVRRQSASVEAPTGLRRITSARSSQEAPTGGKVTLNPKSVEESPAGMEPADQPDILGRAGAQESDARENEAPSVGAYAAPGHGDGVLSEVFPGTAPAPAETGPSSRADGPVRTSPEAPAAVDSHPAAAEVKPLPQDMAIMERRLKTLRNLMIVTMLLIVVLGAVLLYHLRG